MRRTEAVDLSTIAILSIDLPARGECLIPLDAARRMAVPPSPVALSPATTTPPAPLFGPDARITDVMPRYLASGENFRR